MCALSSLIPSPVLRPTPHLCRAAASAARHRRRREVFWGSTQDMDSEGNPTLTWRKNAHHGVSCPVASALLLCSDLCVHRRPDVMTG